MADEKYGIATGYNSSLIQEYLKYGDSAIQSKRDAGMQSINQSQNMMYEALGRMQLQTERDIAQRRIQAQRSGMTSSQLAALEMQNIMTGQMGARQIADQYRQERQALEMQYAGAEDELRAGLFEVLNQNTGQVAAVDAQRFAASGIEQIRELWPDATPQQQFTLARQLMGADISDQDLALIENLRSPEMFTDKFLSKSAWKSKYKADSNIDYGDYKRLWEQLNGKEEPTRTESLTEALDEALELAAKNGYLGV